MNDMVFSEIHETYAGTPWSTFFITTQIPPKKSQNAMKTYAAAIHGEEILLFLYDNTTFGSAKDGFLLTDKGFYSKQIPFENNFCALEVANFIRFEDGVLTPKIIIDTDAGYIEMDINNAKATAQEHEALFMVLNDIFEILRNPDSIEEDDDDDDVEENTSKSMDDIAHDIAILNNLLYAGSITQEEFDAKKKQLLGL
jgi:hypothetical protein